MKIPPGYPEDFRTSQDIRLIIALTDWKEFLDELHIECAVAPHVGAPTMYPCMVVTAFIAERWHHAVLSFEDLKMLDGLLDVPGVKPWLRKRWSSAGVEFNYEADGRKRMQRKNTNVDNAESI